MSLTKESKEYYEKTNRSHRNTNGQFFTEDDVKTEVLRHIDIPDGSRILENSCGSGEFIKSIFETNQNVQIDGFDIEPGLVDICNKLYPSANVVCQNFLTLEHEPVYDFVIGNPPYFEMKRKDHQDLMDRYSDVLSGRANIYSMFFKASIDSLREGGQLIYVVPTSMNNGAYFKSLRKYIVDNCNIDLIDVLGRDRFTNVQQNTMIIKLTKLRENQKNNGKYIFQKGSATIFSENYKKLKKLSSKGKTLEEMGFAVYTGNLVWNQHKKAMSNNVADTLLIWASNIVNGSLQIPCEKISNSDEKGQYVSIVDVEKVILKSIVVNRITGAGSNARIKAALVPAGSGYYIENHVNYIIRTDDSEYCLEDLREQLESSDTIEFVKMLTGNTQISKTELQNIIPFTVKKEDS